MDQSELNAVVQKWLESLLHPAENQESPSTLAAQPGSQDLNEVLGKLRHLLSLNDIPKTSLRAGGTHLVVLARSIAAYLLAALDSVDLERASRTLNQHTTKTIMTIFRLTGKKLTPFYHDDRREGILRAAQMALYARYNQYAIQGAAIFHDKPPVFYISDTGYVNDLFNLCGTLGIAISSCRLVSSSKGDIFNAMDISALKSAVDDDLEKGRVPVMVVAYAGTPLAGHVEDMAGIRELCTKHKMWMHVQGHALSSLCLPSTGEEVSLSREADSLTLYPGTWFGLLSSPYLTLHRTPYIVESEIMENSSEFPPSDLELVKGSIPIPRNNWNGMMPGGIAKHFHPDRDCLLLPKPGGEVDYVSATPQDEAGNASPANIPDDEPDNEKAQGQSAAAEWRSKVVVVEDLAPATCNIANAMIARDLQAYFPKVGISPLKLHEHGVSFRFDPINSFPEHSTSLEDVSKFVDALKQRIQSIQKTALARRLIEMELKGRPNLRCLEFPSFFGSGFIQYVPTDWAEKTELTLEEVSELNQFNIELSNILSEKNPSFSPFQHGNFSCIMIKELQADVNLQDFIGELLRETSIFEENKKLLEGMSEKIKKGIETALSDLSKEKEEREKEEGYLRYVPIVGSVLNWFSPTTPTAPHGRTFNLSSGKVADTDTTYKYKMQIEGGAAEEELTGEYTGVDANVSDLPGGGQCAREEVGAMEGNTEANAAPDPSTSTDSIPQGEGGGQEEVGSEVKQEQLQDEAAAT